MRIGNKHNYVNTGNAYQDMDGNMKQFTTVDHDKKTSVSMNVEDAVWSEKAYRKDLLERILDTSASLSPVEFDDFLIRGENFTTIEWNEKMISDDGINLDRLRFLVNILENRKDNK